MQMNGYKLSDRAARAALGEPAVVPRERMKINAQAIAKAKHGSPDKPSPMAMDAATIYAPYEPLPGVLPAGMAQDSCLPVQASGIASWATQGLFHEGQGFFGFPYLAELMQRAEYRHAAEIWAEHAVRKWIKITGGTTEEIRAIEDEFKRLALRDVVQEWCLQDHSYGRAQIFFDFDDADKPNELQTPLLVTPDKITKNRPLQRLTVVEPMWSAPGSYATSNPLRADFYKPQTWFVFGKIVHATRFATLVSRPVADMLKPAYSFGGQSLTQLMKPYVDNWLRTRQAVSDMINTYSVMVLGTDMASYMGASGTGDDLFNRIALFNNLRDNRGSMVIDNGNETLTNVAVPLGGLHELQAQAQEQLASVSRIPLSIYLQITPTGLNSSNDGETRNFYADVHAYQEKNIRPFIAKVLAIAQLSLSGKINPKVEFAFIPLWEMSDKDKAEIRKSDADADAVYIDRGVVSPDESRERLNNDEDGLYEGVDLGGEAPGPPDDGNEQDDNGGLPSDG